MKCRPLQIPSSWDICQPACCCPPENASLCERAHADLCFTCAPCCFPQLGLLVTCPPPDLHRASREPVPTQGSPLWVPPNLVFALVTEGRASCTCSPVTPLRDPGAFILGEGASEALLLQNTGAWCVTALLGAPRVCCALVVSVLLHLGCHPEFSHRQ